MSVYHKIIELSITIVSLISLAFNFIFPHVALANNIGRNNVLSFNFSEKTKILPFVLGKNSISLAKIANIDSEKKENYKALVLPIEPTIEKNNKVERFVALADASFESKTAYVESAGEFGVRSKKKVLITAYSSTPDQTDSSPLITASNKHVRDGIVAANFLPFGTKVRIPAYSGDKIYAVEDRMRSNVKMDIWFPTRQAALNFGARYLEVEILEAL